MVYKIRAHILNLIILLGIVLSAESAPKQAKLSKHPVLLVVSYDGFRFDYMTKVATPNLESVKNEGVSVPYMKARFPTKTFPNHQSIATGLNPESHGVTDNTVFDPIVNGTLTGFTDDPGFWNYRDDVLPIWIRNEQAGDDRVSGCFMWAGSSIAYGPNGTLLPHYVIPKYDESIPWDVRVNTVISWITNDTKPANMVFLYHNEPDSQGHSFGTDDNETLVEIQKTDNRTGYLIEQLKAAGIYDQINLMIVSDHGMQTVTSETIINITAMADTTLYNRYGGSPVYHIKPKDSVNLDQLYNTFQNESQTSNFSVYKKEEMTHLNYTDNRRIMDLILLADPGYAFDDVRLNERGNYGVHGYDNSAVNMRAFFLARGPLFKKNYQSPTFFNNVDLFPLFCKIMGFPEAPNNGTLTVVSQFLVTDNSTTTPTQTTSVPTTTVPTIPSTTGNGSSNALIITVNFGLFVSLICCGYLFV